MKRKKLDAGMLREVLDYDPDTGRLVWKERAPHQFPAGENTHPGVCQMWNKQRAGKEALTANINGYKVGAVMTVRVYAHRVAWAIHYGEWPEHDIDHINGDRGDNRIVNLRAAPRYENNRNRRMNRRNTSGVTGVHYAKTVGKWMASITVEGVKKNLGMYDQKEDAISARQKAERDYGYHPRHGRDDRPRYPNHR